MWQYKLEDRSITGSWVKVSKAKKIITGSNVNKDVTVTTKRVLVSCRDFLCFLRFCLFFVVGLLVFASKDASFLCDLDSSYTVSCVCTGLQVVVPWFFLNYLLYIFVNQNFTLGCSFASWISSISLASISFKPQVWALLSFPMANTSREYGRTGVRWHRPQNSFRS